MAKKPAKMANREKADVAQAPKDKIVRILPANDRSNGYVAWYSNRRVAAGSTKEECAATAVRNGFSVKAA
jgi:hypothetical protein